jgi:hypothetical protein
VDACADTNATTVTSKTRTVAGVGTAAWAVGEMTILPVSR